MPTAKTPLAPPQTDATTQVNPPQENTPPITVRGTPIVWEEIKALWLRCLKQVIRDTPINILLVSIFLLAGVSLTELYKSNPNIWLLTPILFVFCCTVGWFRRKNFPVQRTIVTMLWFPCVIALAKTPIQALGELIARFISKML